MRRLCRILVLGTLLLSLSGVAQAVTSKELFTPMLRNDNTTGGGLVCRAVNVSSDTRTIHIQIINEFGVTAAVLSDDLTSVSPGHGASVRLDGTQATGIHYCKITVDGQAASIRGALEVNDGPNWSLGAVKAE